MEFISRLFCAFLSLFFGDFPFPLDDHIPVQEPVVFTQIDEEPVLATPHFERWWNPTITSTPKPKRLFSGPESDVIIPEVRSIGIQLPLNNYLSGLKVAGKSLNQAPVMAPVKRMGLRV
jgi:hypothetical protein